MPRLKIKIRRCPGHKRILPVYKRYTGAFTYLDDEAITVEDLQKDKNILVYSDIETRERNKTIRESYKTHLILSQYQNILTPGRTTVRLLEPNDASRWVDTITGRNNQQPPVTNWANITRWHNRYSNGGLVPPSRETN